MTVPETETDGRRDFDFLFGGTWQIHNRKLADALDPACTDWVEFAATGTTQPVLAGLGNVDSYSTDELPGAGRFEGMALRLFDPDSGYWRVWWASSTRPGVLDVPVVGRFAGGRGELFCDDTMDGREVKVRYMWRDIAASSARWEQAFSFDGGQTWHTNWVMSYTRS